MAEFELSKPVPVRPRYTYAYVTAESAGRDKPRLYRDCVGIGHGDWDQLNLRLLTDLNRNAVDQYKGFAAHSGVLGVNGRAIALPADTGQGKSTLTAAAVAAGFKYGSDESLCIDFDSEEVTPYAKPITLSSDSCRLVGFDAELPESGAEVPLLPEQLGGTSATGPMSLSDVVFHEYGHSKPTLTPLPASEIVAGLLRLSFNHYKNPAESFRLVTNLARSANGWLLTYDDPMAAAELLRSELG